MIDRNSLKVLVLVFLAIVLNLSVANAQDEASATYVGSEKCAECHEDVAKALTTTGHGKKAFDEKSDKGCETCHGPGSAHVDSGDPAQIQIMQKLKSAESAEVCLQCHETGMQSHWKGSVHDRRGLSCVNCHAVHHPKSVKSLLKVASSSETCYQCHQQVKSQMQRTSHHPVREGLMTCASCHNPHGTDTPKNLTANSVNELCFSCHTEKRGPFLWEHPPVAENCLSCHTPHGSSHPKLLAEKRPYLCQRCHLDTRHPGTMYDGSTIPTSNREFARSCSNCHLSIHGSNHPSGTFFLR